jgi:hypothetical protein
VDVWSPLVTQLGLPVALVCFLVWQWAERDKLTQDRFAKLDTSTTERERENAARIMKLEDTMQNALRLALDESIESHHPQYGGTRQGRAHNLSGRDSDGTGAMPTGDWRRRGDEGSARQARQDRRIGEVKK